MDTYPDTFAFVQIHHGDNYATPWGNARGTFYQFGGYPTSYFDGTIERAGAWPYTTYRTDYFTRRGIRTWTTIDLVGVEVSGQTYDVWATVCMEADAMSTEDLRIYMVQVLDYWPWSSGYSRNGFKQAAATQDITLSPGTCQVIHRTFSFDGDSWAVQDDIKIIAWAQKPQDSSPPGNRAEVFQAAILTWPFTAPGLPGDFDGDQDVDEDDYNTFVPCFTGVDGGPFGLGCAPGDFEWDGDIDCEDWDNFVLAWTAPGDPPAFAVCSIVKPTLAPAPHDTRKNRYVSLTPGNEGYLVAHQVELVSSTYFPESIGLIGWTGEPYDASCVDDQGNPLSNDPPCLGDFVSRLVDEPYYAETWPTVLHVADCAVVPAAIYWVRATVDGANFTDPLQLNTSGQPFQKWWADLVGAQVEGEWTGPDMFVNFDDIQAAIQTFEAHPTAPHWTWVDMEDTVPNAIINMADVQLIILAFEGAEYPFSVPADCP